MNILTTIKYLLIALLSFFAPIQTLIFAVLGLILLDTITGVYKAYSLNEEITSHRFGNVVSKMLMYNIAIMSGYLVQFLFGIQAFHLAQIVAICVGLTELKSVAENVNAVTGIDIWKYVVTYLNRQKDDVSQSVKDTMDKK
jgi:hypothetical protein